MSVEIVGLLDLKRNITKYQTAAQKEILQGMAKGMTIMGSAARSFAPVRTGFLRQNINDPVIGRNKTKVVLKSNGIVESEITSKADYSVYQEFGTHKMRAHPYLRPAIDTKKGALVDELAKAIKKAELGI